MEKKIGKQLTIYIALLAIVWILLLTVQVRLAKKAYSHQKDLFEVKLNTVFNDALASVDSLDYNDLDSLVTASLQAYDIPYPHDLGVYLSEEGKYLTLTENAEFEALFESGFRYQWLHVTNDEPHIETIFIHFPSLVP